MTVKTFFAPPKSISCQYSTSDNTEDSTPFRSSAPKLISRQGGVSKLGPSLETRLLNYSCSLLLKRPSLSLYNPSARTKRKIQPILLRRRIYWSVTLQWMSYCRMSVCCGNGFTEPLRINVTYSYGMLATDMGHEHYLLD
jgi:hypothetical protein